MHRLDVMMQLQCNRELFIAGSDTRLSICLPWPGPACCLKGLAHVRALAKSEHISRRTPAGTEIRDLLAPQNERL